MSGFTRTVLTALVFPSVVFAGTMGPVCDPGNVTTPCDPTAWNFGMSALYLKPTYSAGFGYVNSVVTSTGARIFRDYHDNSHWGFKLEGSYHWSPGSDLDINWYHVKFNSDRRDLGPISILTDVVVSGGLYERDTHWDAVNAELGQVVMAGSELMRVHAGLHFASIETDEDRFLPGVEAAIPSWTEFRKSEFDGLGARAGFDSTYRFGGSFCGLGVYVKSAAAVLVGTSSFEDLTTLPTAFGGLPQMHGSKTAVIPELEAKLGVSYEYAMAQADLLCDIGYMWANYFNGQHNLNLPAMEVKEADFAVSGLYFGIVYKGYV